MSRTSVNRAKICCATATPRGNLKWEERDSNPLTASPLRQFVNAGQIYSLLPLSSLYVVSTAWRVRTPDTTGWSRMFYHWTKAVFCWMHWSRTNLLRARISHNTDIRASNFERDTGIKPVHAYGLEVHHAPSATPISQILYPDLDSNQE